MNPRGDTVWMLVILQGTEEHNIMRYRGSSLICHNSCEKNTACREVGECMHIRIIVVCTNVFKHESNADKGVCEQISATECIGCTQCHFMNQLWRSSVEITEIYCTKHLCSLLLPLYLVNQLVILSPCLRYGKTFRYRQ